jgi:drug/metabolite transporter (DMT)-like permease
MKIQEMKKATVIGYIALLFWITSPALAYNVKSLPTFEILSFALGISFVLTLIRLLYTQQWHILKQPIILWVIGFTGIYANDALYISAFKYAPPDQTELIDMLWPILVLLFSALLPKENFSLKHTLAGILGFTGAFIFLTKGQGFSGFHTTYLYGYMLAFSSAVIWSLYTVIGRYYGNTPPELIGLFCGCGMCLSLITHFSTESTVIPTTFQWMILLIMGITTQGAAYFFWNYGIKKGNFRLLSLLSYGNLILSMLFLILLGYAELTTYLIVACLFVTFGAVMCRAGS